MSTRQNRISLSILILGLLLQSCATSKFPLSIQESGYESEIITKGCQSSFRDGVCYRYPNMVPMIEVTGDHYEMGLQYGVLLRSEIISSLESYNRIFQWNSRQMGVPHKLMMSQIRNTANKMARNLPQRFLDEAEGLAEGAGISADDVLLVSLFYDVGEVLACTSVVMQGEYGQIIHGRNNDTTSFGADELGKLTVIARHNATGYNSVTHIDYPLYMGLQTAYNNKGITFSEETYELVDSGKDEFSFSYLMRMALETSDTLDQVEKLFDEYALVGGHGNVMCDLDEKESALYEITPGFWVRRDMNTPLGWNLNHIESDELIHLQSIFIALMGNDSDRDFLASNYPYKEAYTHKDAVLFLRSDTSPDDINYNSEAQKNGICNSGTQQMIVFDSIGDGFYLAIGNNFAAQRDVYHVYNDFSIQPDLFMESEVIDPEIQAMADIRINIDLDYHEKAEAYLNLIEEYPDNIALNLELAMYYQYLQVDYEKSSEYSEKAYTLNPHSIDTAFLSGLYLFKTKNLNETVKRMKPIDPIKLTPWDRIMRLSILTAIYKSNENKKWQEMQKELDFLIAEYNAEKIWDQYIHPFIKEVTG